MANALQHFLQFIFPITCVLCGKDLPGDDYYRLCKACEENIRPIEGLYCRKCGRPLPDGGEHCYRCRKESYHFDCVRSYAPYGGTVKELLLKFKYGHRDYLDRFLGRALADSLKQYPYMGEVDAVVPVPLHWFRRLQRGYNQAELLAGKVAAAIGKPLLKKKLSRYRVTRAQYRLARDERRENLRDSFFVSDSKGIRDRSLLLVDDICTTCATIEECARVLRRAGAKKVFGLTVARD